MEVKTRLDEAVIREKRHQRRQRRMLWIGLVAVLLPLIILLVAQYRWLIALEDSSKVARRATLENYLNTVVKGVRYKYATLAERSLNLPAYLLDPEYQVKTPKYLKKKGVSKGVRWFFVVNFRKDAKAGVLFYDPCTYQEVEPAAKDPKRLAVYMAVGPWKYLSKKIESDGPFSLSTEERDPEHRMILNPIFEEGQMMGMVGLMLDEAYFKETFLPKEIGEVMPDFAHKEGWSVTVRDANQKVFFQSAPTVSQDPSEEVSVPFDFVFTDMTLRLSATNSSEQWAKTNFAFNISVSVALAAALLGGILLVMRMASREMKLSEMKNDFVSNVSHELRTPLSSIRVFGEFLRLGRVKNEAKIREYGEYIETESRRLTQLINNILDFSRIESGRKLYRFEATDLAELLCDVTETFKVRLSHEGFDLSLRLPKIKPPEVHIDGDAIAQALANLIDNAVKYSNGGRRIEVLLHEVKDWLVIAVKDEGIGIAADEKRKIFERFHRIGTDLVHDVKGSGLGLSIVHHIVKAHGGKVEVESELGRGSTFSIYLPLEQEAEAVIDLPLEHRAAGQA